MPRTKKALIHSDSKPPAVEGAGGFIAVERTARVLAAFSGPDAALSLAQIAERTQLPKSTALRIARALAWANLLVQREDARWRLGPAIGWLGARYQEAFDLADTVTPLLRKLALQSGESASLFVREGDTRICLLRVEHPTDSRPPVHPGTAFPLAKGAPGRVILAFSGQPGEVYEKIRRLGYHIAIRERSTDGASVAAPVFGSQWRVLGAISLSGPADRLTLTRLNRMAKPVMEAARLASTSLGGSFIHRLGKKP
jgi:DNA-binding IclR family transcriptional regulator